MLWRSVLPVSLLFVRAYAGLEAMGADRLMGGSAELERRIEYFGEEEDLPAHIITKRQSGGVVLNQDGTINMTAWDEKANKACQEALLKLPESTNPSGTCVCYNLPALNNITGTFEADLRLYQRSAPTGPFAGIPPQKIQVSLQYRGASVSPISAAAASQMVMARQEATVNKPQQLRLLQTYLFLGQIDKDKMTGSMTMAALEALVMPTVTLSGFNPTGQTVSTNVSSNEAAFVAGVFSETIVMSEFAAANAAVDRSLVGLANGTVPFVLPGVALMIFPVGLIITSIWTVLLVGAIGFGTFERIGFREQYRSRMTRAGKANVSRI